MGKISVEKLETLIKNGEVNTVIVADVDIQGRLFGKRVPARHFLDIKESGINTAGLNYTWDISQMPVDAEFCNWDSGLQDINIIPDFSTLRLYPWSQIRRES